MLRILTGGSLVVAIAIMLLWARSLTWGDFFGFHLPGGDWRVRSYAGLLDL